MEIPKLTPDFFWRFTCEPHGWASNRVPCPGFGGVDCPEGKDNGPKPRLPGGAE